MAHGTESSPARFIEGLAIDDPRARARRAVDGMIEAVPREPQRSPGGIMAKRSATAQTGDLFAPSLENLREEAMHCHACPLYKNATQTVFGEGPARARIMLVGEQPGDKEDLEGKPFVGPAGRLLDKALEDAGIDRRKVYVTNAVKHFKFEPRGKFRLHKKPMTSEIKACHRWLAGEIAAVQPDIVVAMGATAVIGVFGKAMPIGANRGRAIAIDDKTRGFITVHPSYLLRVEDADKEREYARFVHDLRKVAAL
jgi:DNA polymerase